MLKHVGDFSQVFHLCYKENKQDKELKKTTVAPDYLSG